MFFLGRFFSLILKDILFKFDIVVQLNFDKFLVRVDYENIVLSLQIISFLFKVIWYIYLYLLICVGEMCYCLCVLLLYEILYVLLGKCVNSWLLDLLE